MRLGFSMKLLVFACDLRCRARSCKLRLLPWEPGIGLSSGLGLGNWGPRIWVIGFRRFRTQGLGFRLHGSGV